MINPFRPPVTVKSKKDNIPKNTNVFSLTPVVFETKRQYVNELVHNQEKINHTHFPKQQIQKFKKEELVRMAPVIARYTTTTNPFMPCETVFFTDNKISPERMAEMSTHEFLHQIIEPVELEESKEDKK